MESLLTTKPGRAYSILKSMGARPGEDLDGTNFTLPEFEGMDLTPDQIADKIANFFAQISQQYQPVDVARLPEALRKDIMDSTPD